jgi:hypothetical protein
VGRNQRRRADRTNRVRNQPGDPSKATSPDVVRPSPSNVRELNTLAPAFIGWYGEHPFIADVGAVLENLNNFFRYYPEFDENRAITALDPYEVAAKLASLIINAVYEGLAAAYSLMQFLNFLHDSGRWSGSPESYRAVNGILTDIICLDMGARLRALQM